MFQSEIGAASASANRRQRAIHPEEFLPPENVLAMPEQDFSQNPERAFPKSRFSSADFDAIAQRVLVLALTLLPALLAALELKRSIGQDGFSGWEIAYLSLFVPLFAWISFGFATSAIGFIITAFDRARTTYRPRRVTPLEGRTAILVPVCNEDFIAVLGRISIMERSLAQVMGGDRFDFFILSDSNPENGKEEQRAYRQMRASFSLQVYYRRRQINHHRKPGNITEWVTRFGGGYDYMIVLDADSVMGGQTMARLAADMENHPRLGLIQTVPTVVGASTLFARWQQFANRLYGPMASRGMIWWSRSEGTFWGHNAIIRVKAFAEGCGLPTLKGPAPFGGHIMSHDMVEAALLRRRGWEVHMVLAEDSYEEFPPALPDLATRDRRWCQGNVQHVPLLLRVAGLHIVNRFQLLVGASAYLTSPMWLALILITISGEANGVWHVSEILPSNRLLWLTLVLLFAPKFMALALSATNATLRNGFGGIPAMTKGVIVECLLSIMMAPVAMLTQTINLIGILIGVKSQWNGQTRDRDGMSMWSAIWTFKYHLLLGTGLLAAAIYSQSALLWLMPVVAGLLFAPALAALTARKDLGRMAAAHGLFIVPHPWWQAPGYRADLGGVRVSKRKVGPAKPAVQFAANDS